MSTRRAKRIGTIEPSSNSYRQKTVEDIISDGKLMTLTMFYYPRKTDIFIGNQQIYCAYAQVYHTDDGIAREMADLHKIRWDSECSYDEPFKQGEDTAMLFSLLITLIKDRFPTVKVVSFNDASSRKCDNNMGTMNLGVMKLFTDGKTWYEQHFKAYIDPNNKTAYENKMKESNDTKRQMTWEEAKRNIEWNASGIAESELKQKYEETTTWRQWLRWIRTTLKDSAFCIWLTKNDWFDIFVRSVLRFDIMNYRFLVDTTHFNQQYTIKKIGGRREGTRKKRQ